MTNHRFFCPSSWVEKGKIILRGREAFHLVKILRAKRGQKIRVFTEKGTEFLCEIDTIKGLEITASIEQKIESKVEPEIKIHIVQAMVKAAKMDIILQKCTEVGVYSFLPVISEYSVRKPNQPEKQLERWDKIVLEAVKQSERRHIPPVYNIIGLAEWLKSDINKGIKLHLDARGGDSMRRVLGNIKEKEKQSDCSNFILAIGPEGGFSKTENDMLAMRGFLPVCLGPRILRAETVAPLVSAILLYEFDSD